MKLDKHVSLELNNVNNRLTNNKKSNSTYEYLITKFPHDVFNQNEVNYTCMRYQLELTRDLSDRLVQVSNGSNHSLYILMLSSIMSLLYKYSGDSNVSIAVPFIIKGAVKKSVQECYLINVDMVNHSFLELLDTVKEQYMEMNRMNCCSEREASDKIISLVNTDFNPQKLFKTLVLFDHLHDKSLLGKCEADFGCIISNKNSSIDIDIEYNSSFYSNSMIHQIANHFIQVVKVSLETPKISVKDLCVLPDEDIETILGFNNKLPGDLTKHNVIDIFTDCVHKRPSDTALVCENKTLTYQELNRISNILARVLQDNGIKRGDNIGFMIKPSVEMIVAILGILKTGAAYVPLSPSYPKLRIDKIIDDCTLSTLVVSKPSELYDSIDIEKIYLDGVLSKQLTPEINNNIHIQPEDTAYILYTSGSTGNPKGSMISHNNIAKLVDGLYKEVYSKYNERLNVALVAPSSFDASVQQIFASLLLGHTLCIMPEYARKDGNEILNFYMENSIDITDATPSLMNIISNSTIKLSDNLQLKHVIVGGEALSTFVLKSFCRRLKDKCPEITNVYGVTECCVDSTAYSINLNDINEISLIPIGKPLMNQKIYVLDDRCQLVPICVPGELYIGGTGVGKGYINNPQLNSIKFIENPYQEGEFIYRTGDVAKWNFNEEIEFLGRIDNQVKIRGHRIELEEIESILLKYGVSTTLEEQVLDNKRYCIKCLLSSSDHGVSIGDDDICNVCKDYNDYKENITKYFKQEIELKSIIDCKRGESTSQYDCMLLFSGGKDSTYVLCRLVEMGYKVLAFTFDNGYISDDAFENIRRMTKELSVDSIVASLDNMDDVFLESLKEFDTVCDGCFKVLTTLSTKIAIDKGINIVITGLSRGQILDTKLYPLVKQGIHDINEIDEKLILFREMYHSIGNKMSQLIDLDIDVEQLNKIEFLDFFRYYETSADDIKVFLDNKSHLWVSPEDTGFCSTNCTINDVGIYVHKMNKGYHNYASPLSWDSRMNIISRENGLKELNSQINHNNVSRIIEKIGFDIETKTTSQRIVDAIVVEVKENYNSSNLCAYYVSENEISSKDLKAHLSIFLPQYMVPLYYVHLDEIPLTHNNKIDYRLLPTPKSDFTSNCLDIKPVRDVERSLITIFRDVLSLEKIGIYDNFHLLGGDSLKFVILIAKIHQTLNVEISINKLFELSNISLLADYIENQTGAIYKLVTPIDKKDYYAVSSSQKRMFVVEQYSTSSTSYNVTNVLQVEGDLDIKRFKESVHKLIRRHESLRTTFTVIEEEPVQIIHEDVQLMIKEFELNEDIDSFIEDFVKPFDLEVSPLLRVSIGISCKKKYYIFIDTHHIIVDGTSLSILIDELISLYLGEDLEPVLLQYKDFSEWQNRFLCSDEIENQKKFWVEIFAEEIPVLDLPCDYSRPVLQSFDGNTLKFEVTKSLSDQLRNLCREREVTIFMLLLSTYYTLIWRYTNQEDIVIGTGVAGRKRAEFQKVIGMFVNMLPIRINLSGDMTFDDLLKQVKKFTLSAFENSDYQFEMLVDDLKLDRDFSRNPIFDTIFVLQNMNASRNTNTCFNVHSYNVPTNISKFDLSLYAYENDGTLKFEFEYNTHLFAEQTIRQMITCFHNILFEITECLSLKLSNINYAKKFLLSNKDQDFTFKSIKENNVSVVEMFREQVIRKPNSVAVFYEGEQLTYSELDNKSSEIANFINTKTHNKVGGVVGIILERSIHMITAILGVMKSGLGYLPIDGNMPYNRIKYIIDDSQTNTLITSKQFITMVNKLQWDCQTFNDFICIDCNNIVNVEESKLNNLMNQQLWNSIGINAKNEIEAGGWKSSYTGKNLTKEEMDEYASNAFLKLQPYLSDEVRVLEIGCASGITMFKIAPYVKYYCGIDLSETIINRNKEIIEQRGIENIEVKTLLAHEVDLLKDADFDIVIMNSVIQSFHGHNYLKKVISKCIGLLKCNGILFLGDIMDNDRKQDLIDSVTKYKRINYSSNVKTDFSEELFISRDFLLDLKNDYKEIAKVSFFDKKGLIENELTLYRYDSIIELNKESFDYMSQSCTKKKHQFGMDILSELDKKIDHRKILAKDIAYVIYTSGTTGKPKGVVVNHSNIINLVSGLNERIYMKYDEQLNIALVAPYFFDASVQQIFSSLLLGHKLCIVPEEVRKDGNSLIEYYINNSIDISDGTPIHLHLLSNSNVEKLKMPKLKELIIGGEVLTVDVVRSFYSSVKDTNVSIVNIYGLTECCVDSLAYQIDYEKLSEYNRIPIGKPLANQQVYVLGKSLELLPPDIIGELYIGGGNIGNGYLNNDELTKQKFILNPYISGEYMFKTGDLAKSLPDGNFVFIGRVDSQVKVKGYRIELTEVEKNIRHVLNNNTFLNSDMISEKNNYVKQHQGVVVVDRDDKLGNKYLCAYIEGTRRVDNKLMKNLLSKLLPEYMIPLHFQMIEKLPITPNGKLNRNLLPEPCHEYESYEDIELPIGIVEEKLAAVWIEVLGGGRIRRDDNFFNLGGDSIKAIQISARMKKYDMKLEIKDILRYPVLRDVCEHIECIVDTINQGLVQGIVPLTPIQKKFFEFDSNDLHHFNQSVMIYNSSKFDSNIIKSVLVRLITHHDALRSCFDIQDDGVIQSINATVVKNNLLKVVDVSSSDDVGATIEHNANIMQQSFDLKCGPLIKACHFKTSKGDHLLLIAHHLVIDGVSWRILLDDFTMLYNQMANSKEMRLPRKTSSYKEWSLHLEDYLENGITEEEIIYWKHLTEKTKTNLPVKNISDDNCFNSRSNIQIELTELDTNKLLSEVYRAYKTDTTEVLLIALAFSLNNVFGVTDIFLNLEKHGRDVPVHNIDVTRTIGWFTTIFPVHLEVPSDKEYSYQIRSIKDDIRRIPNSGVGYGIIKYLSNKHDFVNTITPDISFNYLGQVDDDLNSNLFTVSRYNMGDQIAKSFVKEHLIEINCLVIERKFKVEINYSTSHFQSEKMELFAAKYKRNITDLIDHCTSTSETLSSPGDMLFKDMTIEIFDEIEELINTKESYEEEN